MSYREVTVNEVFSWGEDMARKAKDIFGTHRVLVSPQTFSDIKERCFQMDLAAESYRFPPRRHLNSIELVIREGIPDGIVRSSKIEE